MVDSRLAEEGAAIRRRRECLSCQYRFTTFERMEGGTPTFVVKADGRREPFDRTKVAIGIAAATKGRRLDGTSVDELAERVEESLRTCGPEISSAQIGLAVLDQLRPVDEVAYLRFASVYKHFDAAADFHREIELLTKQSSRRALTLTRHGASGRTGTTPRRRRAGRARTPAAGAPRPRPRAARCRRPAAATASG